MGQADYVVALHFPAGALAQAAGDAGIQVDVHGGMSGVVAMGMGQRIGSRLHMMNRGLGSLGTKGNAVANLGGIDG